jgi:hypothetical protein
VNFTLVQTNLIPVGPRGTYDDLGICNTSFLQEPNGSFYCLWEANSYEGPYYVMCAATAPAITGPWTKSPSNPIDALDINIASGPCIINVGGTRYVYVHSGNAGGSDIFRCILPRHDGLLQRYPSTPVFTHWLAPPDIGEGNQTSDPSII